MSVELTFRVIWKKGKKVYKGKERPYLFSFDLYNDWVYTRWRPP